jgi:hypothetical protein
MFEQVTGIRTRLALVAAQFDPQVLDAASVVPVYQQLDQIKRAAESMQLLLARRVEEVEQWKRAGYASAAEYLAAQSGSSVAAARDVLATSSKLAGLPVVEDALRAGKLSGSQAVAVTDAAAAAPGQQSRLVNDAQRTSVAELRQACLRTKTAADADREATGARIHRQRHLRTFTDGEGARNMHVRGPVDQVARIESALQPFIDEAFAAARAEGRHEEREAYAFDALTGMADALSGGVWSGKSRTLRNTMFIRVDLEALKRGEVDGDELCEIPGVGPLAVSAARQLLGDSILKLVITRGVDVVNVTHLGRGPTIAQEVALLFRQPLCTVEGCYRTRVEYDHTLDWRYSRHTRVDELATKCGFHHAQKTVHGWALVEGTGKRPMVPPDHPRHPDNQHKPPP